MAQRRGGKIEMITKLILDITGLMAGNQKTELLRADTPVAFLGFNPDDCVRVELPDRRIVEVEARAVYAHEPEETLSVLSDQTGIGYDTLARAARDGRLLARQSGVTWLSTESAVQAALKLGHLQPREK
jgi:hypothetical protein